MADTIKTQLLKALVPVIETASSLLSVQRTKPPPIEVDIIRGPAAFIYEAVPETRSPNNRYYEGVLELAIMVFIELQSSDASNNFLTFNDTADTIQGELHDILFGVASSGLRGLALKVEETTMEKAVPNPAWGVLVYTVQITYAHLTGNAFKRKEP